MEEKKLTSRQALLALLFGALFGFILQKGGVGKYEVLVGALLLRDFTVWKIMLSAILTGMIGIFTLHKLDLVQLKRKPTVYGKNIIGGLIFGAGFGLLGYCPGTAAVALGQGNLDAVAGITGLILGSFLYAEVSESVSKKLSRIGSRGDMSLAQLYGMSELRAVLITAIGIVLFLVFLP